MYSMASVVWLVDAKFSLVVHLIAFVNRFLIENVSTSFS